MLYESHSFFIAIDEGQTIVGRTHCQQLDYQIIQMNQVERRSGKIKFSHFNHCNNINKKIVILMIIIIVSVDDYRRLFFFFSKYFCECLRTKKYSQRIFWGKKQTI